MPSPTAAGAVVLMAFGFLYPAFVYGLKSVLPPQAFTGLALLLVGLRAATLGSEATRTWRGPLISAGVVIAVSAALDGQIAAKIYPFALSLAAAYAFGNSLRKPPCLIERIARMGEPDMPAAGQTYCRIVTLIWTVWLVVNAAIAALLAIRASEEAWALWTGFLAYLIMGVLFGGEMLIRPRLRARAVRA
jgi:uncharacterized membrane protein